MLTKPSKCRLPREVKTQNIVHLKIVAMMENQNESFPQSKHINTLYKYDTEYSADSVEWCPHDPYRNFFVCGSYQLREEQNSSSDKRLGRIMVFSISSKGLELHQTLDTAAILDQKWCPNQINGNILLGVVNAKRTLEIFEFQHNKLQHLTKFVFIDDETETLILSLDWSTWKNDSQQPDIVCSDSKGNIHLLQFINSELVLQKSWHGHDFQAWIAGFYYWDTNIIFSGGDDAVFLKFDRRCGDIAIAKNRQHETGVTSFQSNKSREFVVVTGSYDEHVRLWDIRNIKNSLDKLKMPGTLWRLKWDPFCQKFLLAACMLGGVHIIDATQSTEMKILDSYYEHKNISYGADWSFMVKDEVHKFDFEGNAIIGSCSFYDHLLCVSKISCDFE